MRLLTVVVVSFLVFSLLAHGAAATDLETAFTHPPDSAKPWVFWVWLDGNLTREGITADLESMKRVGIGGVVIMEVDQKIPKGPVRFMSPQWRGKCPVSISQTAAAGATG